MRKEEKTEVRVRQVPIVLEDGRRIVPKVFKNKDSSAPNLSADFQKDIEDFVGKSGERREKSNGFTKRIFFQSTEEIEEVTSRTRQGLTRPRRSDGEDSVDGEGKAETREKQSRRSLPPEAGFVRHTQKLMVITQVFQAVPAHVLAASAGGDKDKMLGDEKTREKREETDNLLQNGETRKEKGTSGQGLRKETYTVSSPSLYLRERSSTKPGYPTALFDGTNMRGSGRPQTAEPPAASTTVYQGGMRRLRRPALTTSSSPSPPPLAPALTTTSLLPPLTPTYSVSPREAFLQSCSSSSSPGKTLGVKEANISEIAANKKNGEKSQILQRSEIQFEVGNKKTFFFGDNGPGNKTDQSWFEKNQANSSKKGTTRYQPEPQKVNSTATNTVKEKGERADERNKKAEKKNSQSSRIPDSETKNGGTPIKPDEKNPFLMDNSDDDDDAEEEDIREKEEKTESEGFEGGIEFERLATSTACFACDVSTQTPLPAKPCCRIM